MLKNIKDVKQKKFTDYPERILQFGEGNFLRAFADWMVEKANEDGVYEGTIVACQPINQGLGEILNAQDCMYNVLIRGMENHKPVEQFKTINSISRCINPYEDYEALMELATNPQIDVIISNTTESGIVYSEGDKLGDKPPKSFPAKVCAFLYNRYKHFNGDPDKGMLLLPVELIDNNGAMLKKIVIRYATEWNLGDEFIDWVENYNEFASTLVDRIVPGYPRTEIDSIYEKLGYEDKLVVTCESFNLWVIEADSRYKDRLPIHKTSANVIWTDDVTPYKKRKVRILNGSHTAVVPCAFIAGFNTVLEFFRDDLFGGFEKDLISKEIIPATNMSKEELESFAASVLERFDNPYIVHNLIDITLNDSSKFNARCLPTIIDYYNKFNSCPKHFAFSLAGFIRFYKVENQNGEFVGKRDSGETYKIKDDASVLEFFTDVWKSDNLEEIVCKSLANTNIWSQNLNELGDLKEQVLFFLNSIRKNGMKEAMKQF
ncbi:altronate oxidoreductase [Candidatus Epulonipiscium fishelsonii]|uniref:Altronate oxidoreductase n=1 Tax=Candidatus Epulonipiscium fishelsonii TaxID=77094 RepID=A0ACC8XD99_9FIRM|nr:altronate oxidoreductase [Epulopiscium sp. SCG-B11WGA-EpuloA1]ONI41774.1 altronate oxidoreductase [Epulopiscium sp. SCG-B05WGA-EpuloA1]